MQQFGRGTQFKIRFLGQQPVVPPAVPPIRPPTIRVEINTPQIKIVEIGETTEFNCHGYYVLNKVSS